VTASFALRQWRAGLCAALAGIGVMATTPVAVATGLPDLRPASDEAVRPVSWTGFILSPSLGTETLKFNGTGSPLLKTAKGFGIGAEVGYDRQIGGVVLGVVGVARGTRLDGDSTDGVAQALKSRMDAYGTLRARIGVPIDRLMVFGTVGLALGRLQIENQPLGLSDRHTLTGWVAGGGVEYVYNKKITLRAEYQRVDFGQQSYSSLPAGSRDVGGTFDKFSFGFVTRY
jgi:outer membrane immunogenic protein